MGWPLDPSGYKYRPLKEGTFGYDVFALQTGLTLEADGIFGPITKRTVEAYQGSRKLVVDGIAGAVTQRELVLHAYVYPLQAEEHTPPGLARGQLEAESSFWVGNHSAKYPDGTMDLGVAQQNAQPTDVNCRVRFNVMKAVRAYFDRLVAYHVKYEPKVSARRAWELAAGAWNAPSWCDRLADGKSLSAEQRDHIESYIDRVTVYAEWS